MRLVSPIEVAESIGFEPGVQTAVFEAAVTAATQALESVLQATFERAVVTDTFYVLPNQSLPFAHNVYRTRLALSRGLVSAFTGISYASTLEGLSSGAVNIEAQYMALNPDKGEIVLTGPDLRGQFIAVSYVAGLEADAEGNYLAVPHWLKELAMQQSIVQIDTIAPTLRLEEGAERSIKTMTETIRRNAEAKIRYFPNAVRPIG